MDMRGIDQVLADLRATSQLAAGKSSAVDQSATVGGVDFGQALKAAIDQVSTTQQDAQKLAQDFSTGNPNSNLQDVMVNLQKANLSFQQMVQVRNKLVSAYQEIMNMPV
ncbi:MAG: flagellar hook-basal body complex protein FliE [Rhodocyclaceae bacterium]|jgi:flagellar hook-basal body complex protein FliE